MTRLTVFLLLFAFPTLSVVSAQEEGAYQNDGLQIRLAVPATDYELRSDPATFIFQWKGALCEISSKDAMVGGVLLHFPAAMKAEKYARWREKSWMTSPSVKKYVRVAEKKWERPVGSWLVLEHRMEYEDYDYHYLTLHLAHKRHNFELVLWVSDMIWEEYRAALYGILKSVQYGLPPALEKTGPEKETPVPERETIPEPVEKPETVEKKETPVESGKEPEIVEEREVPALKKETPVESGKEPEIVEEREVPALKKETPPESKKKPEINPVQVPEVPAEKKPQLYVNREHGFRLFIPSPWEVRNREFQFGLDGSLIEFENGENLAGVLGFHEGPISLQEYATAFVKGVEESNQEFEDLGTTKTESGSIVRQCRGKRELVMMRYSLLFAAHEDQNYYLAFWMADQNWSQFEKPLLALFESFAFPTNTGVEKKTSARKAPEKKGEPSHPWQGCNRGSWAEYRTRIENGSSREEMGMRYFLLERGDGYYRMRTDIRVAGDWVEGEAVRIDLASEVPPGKTDGATKDGEKVRVPAGEFLCNLSQTDRGSVWTSEEIPFRLVKSLSLVEGKKTTVILVGFEKK